MEIIVNDWETERCHILEAQELDIPVVTSIFTDNLDAIHSQGTDCQPEEIASILLRHEGLPPGGNPSREQTFLIIDKASQVTSGLLSIYCGYPTEETLYIGSLFFLRDWQRRGLGREVIEDLERRASEKGYRAARVAVGLKNWSALRFWVALDYNRITQITGHRECSGTTFADIELMKNLKLITKR